jgi:hypothetical protein
VVDLYQLTVFESALFGFSSLTKLFATRETFEVLEYLGDLKHYYKTGYGFSINYRQATPLLKDMVAVLKELKANQKSDPKATIYFGHAETIVPLIALLGQVEIRRVRSLSNRRDFFIEIVIMLVFLTVFAVLQYVCKIKTFEC